jgi:hypothetical protein
VRYSVLVVTDDEELSRVIESKLYQQGAAVTGIMARGNKSRLPI